MFYEQSIIFHWFRFVNITCIKVCSFVKQLLNNNYSNYRNNINYYRFNKMTRKQVTWDMINKTARYFGWTVIDNGNFKQYRKDHEVIRIVKKGNLLKIVHITNGKITGQSGYDNELLAKITLIEYINLNLFGMR